MTTADELRRLAKANEILNRSHRRLGIKPLFISDLRQTANELNREIEVASSSNKEKLQINVNAVILVLVISIVCLAMFAFYTKLQNNTKESEPIGLVHKEISDSSPLIISKGHFKTLAEAQKAKTELFEKTGVHDLHIVRGDGSAYSIQIGPEYTKREDAMLVFDELSKYSVSDLSIRLSV